MHWTSVRTRAHRDTDTHVDHSPRVCTCLYFVRGLVPICEPPPLQAVEERGLACVPFSSNDHLHCKTWREVRGSVWEIGTG